LKKRGIFITLEGSEGCGKSTQTRLLRDDLRKEGYEVFTTREPGGTAIGDEVRKILLDPKHRRMSPLAETLLYMASRAQLVEEVIFPKLRKRMIVVCDRWLDATVAYQGYAGGLHVKWIKDLGQVVTQNLVPDLSLYLDLPVSVGLARAKKRRPADRVERKSLTYHESVRQGYLKISKEEPYRFRRLSIGSGETAAHVHERIKAEVERVLSRR
jgi:dTMP kinase